MTTPVGSSADMQPDAMHVVHAHAAGLDVHKMQITASVRLCQPGGGVQCATRQFSALPDGLEALTQWLASQSLASEPAERQCNGRCRMRACTGTPLRSWGRLALPRPSTLPSSSACFPLSISYGTVRTLFVAYLRRVPPIEISATPRYCPDSVGEYEQTDPFAAVPGMSAHALAEFARLCHFEL